MRHIKVDMTKADEVEEQLARRCNIDAAHRLQDMRGLDYRTRKFTMRKVCIFHFSTVLS